MRAVQEQQDLVVAERVRVDRRSRAQTQEFANLTAELLAGRRGPEVQLEGMRIGVKVEKPETYSGKKSRDLDTWLFQVREHLEITTIPARGHVPYALRPFSEGTLRCGGVKSAKETVDQRRGMIFAGCCTSSFGQRTTDAADATSWRQCGKAAEKAWWISSSDSAPRV